MVVRDDDDSSFLYLLFLLWSKKNKNNTYSLINNQNKNLYFGVRWHVDPNPFQKTGEKDERETTADYIGTSVRPSCVYVTDLYKLIATTPLFVNALSDQSGLALQEGVRIDQ